MPVRSLSSSVLKWPDAKTVDAAVRQWAAKGGSSRDGVVAIGYMGSYARGDWGVGSDVDILVILRECSTPWMDRTAAWDVTGLPVPADVLVYTREELAVLRERGRFGKVLRGEVKWVWGRPSACACLGMRCEPDRVVREFVPRVREAMGGVLADIYWFGSRARGEDASDSDYDLLIETTRVLTERERDVIADIAIDVTAEHGVLLDIHYRSSEALRNPRESRSPFTQTVVEEGMLV